MVAKSIFYSATLLSMIISLVGDTGLIAASRKFDEATKSEEPSCTDTYNEKIAELEREATRRNINCCVSTGGSIGPTVRDPRLFQCLRSDWGETPENPNVTSYFACLNDSIAKFTKEKTAALEEYWECIDSLFSEISR